MGKGQALEASKLFPGIDIQLGHYLRKYGNRVFYMGNYQCRSSDIILITFPTKQHYKEPSNTELIAISAQQLKIIADKFSISKIFLPPVGCGLGGLDYKEQVRPILREILDDRFIVVLGYQNMRGGEIPCLTSLDRGTQQNSVAPFPNALST